MKRWFQALLLLPAVQAAGCQSSRQEPASDLVEQTTVGEARCKDAQEQQLRPFVVEWDATDLAQFEAHAQSNVVVVNYQGCELTILDGCRDGGIPGRYGTYQPPVFTSGSLEQLDIENELELYAKLPLGVANFSAKVRQGQSLHMSYFVTGMASATRDTLSAAELADNPRCEGATHFVRQYHLGAFELAGSEERSAGASAAADVVEVGGSNKHSASALKRGGDLVSCSTQDQRSCRAPIRLVLQALSAEQAAPAALAPIGSAPPPATTTQSPKEEAYTLRRRSHELSDAGDGAGCLQLFERADQLDPHGVQENPGWLMYIGICQMQSGACDEGKRTYESFLRSTDKQRALDEETIATRVDAVANVSCTSNTGTPKERITRAYVAITNASRAHPIKADRCLAEVESNEDLLAPLPSREAVDEAGDPYNILQSAAICLAKAKRCEEASKLWERYYSLNWPAEDPAEMKAAAASTFQHLDGCR